MTIYTVRIEDYFWSKVATRSTVGSYTSRKRAIDECINCIFWRLGKREDLARSMANDENHPETHGMFFKNKTTGSVYMRKGCERKLNKFLRDKLGGEGYYHVRFKNDSWCFDIYEEELVGEYWHTVTWGDSGGDEDPEFTTPWPEAFVDRKSAIIGFYDYACSLKKGHGEKISKGFKSFVFNSLSKDGICRVDLGDGSAVSCAIYHDDMKNVKGVNK